MLNSFLTDTKVFFSAAKPENYLSSKGYDNHAYLF